MADLDFTTFLESMNTVTETDFTRKEVYDMGIFDQYQFEDAIQRLDQMTDQQAYELIKANVEYISGQILNKEWKFPDILISDKFLRCYYRVLSSMPVSYAVKVSTNKICYDYFTSGLPQDPMIQETVLGMSKTVNNAYIQAMIGVGIPNELASKLALCRFSTINERVNIRRLNFTMCQQDPELMTVQNIVWIYEKLFDRVLDLFKQTMFEYYSPEQEVDLGNDFQEIYSTISLAILTIVNNMPIADIDKIIRSYVDDWEINRPPTRFSLISLSGDYNRIQRIVEQLTSEGRFVP